MPHRSDRPRREVSLNSTLGSELVAMELAASVARQLGFTSERIDDLKTAVSEATLNAIEHGNALDPRRTVRVTVTPVSDGLVVTVRDQAVRRMPPLSPATQRPDLEPMLNTPDRVRARGWGLFLMRSLADEVTVTSTRNGNVVRLLVRPAAPAGGL